MNEPIISPWLFYWAYVVDGVRLLLAGGAVTALIALWEVLSDAGDAQRELKWIECLSDDNSLKEYYAKERFKCESKVKSAKKWCKRWVATAVVSIMAVVFIPSETTLWRMVISSYATPNNIEYLLKTTGKSLDESVDFVIDKVITAADKWEQRK